MCVCVCVWRCHLFHFTRNFWRRYFLYEYFRVYMCVWLNLFARHNDVHLCAMYAVCNVHKSLTHLVIFRSISIPISTLSILWWTHKCAVHCTFLSIHIASGSMHFCTYTHAHTATLKYYLFFFSLACLILPYFNCRGHIMLCTLKVRYAFCAQSFSTFICIHGYRRDI